MRHLLTLVVLCTGLALVGCGDDDDDDSAGNGQTQPAETTAAEDALAGTGKIVEIAADPSGDLAYQRGTITAEDGKVQIEFTNESSVPHNVVVEGEDGEPLARTDVITSDTAQTNVNLTPGTYTYYCSVDGHRAAGMEATLVIE